MHALFVINITVWYDNIKDNWEYSDFISNTRFRIGMLNVVKLILSVFNCTKQTFVTGEQAVEFRTFVFKGDTIEQMRLYCHRYQCWKTV